MSAKENVAGTPKAVGSVSRILRPIRGRLIAAALLAAMGSMLTLVPLAGIAEMVKIILVEGDSLVTFSAWTQSDLGRLLLVSLASLGLGMVLVSAGELVAHLADNRLTSQLRLDIVERLSRVPLGWFTSRASGEVKQAMQDDIATLHSLTAHFYTSVGRAIGAVLVAAGYLFAQDWRMALVVLLPFLGFVLFLRHAMQVSGTNMQAFVSRLGRINSETTAFVNGIAVAKTFAASGRASRGYHQAVDDFAQAFAAFARPLVGIMAQAHAMIAPVTVLGLVLVSGVLFVTLGWMVPVDLLPFVLVAPGICAPMLLLHTLLHDLQGAAGAAKRVLSLLDTPLLEAPAPDEAQRPQGQGVRFEGLSYAYADGQKVLVDISVDLPPGKVTAVVGASGAGKSTLARLLLRFFDPTEGRITLGGVDIRQLDTTTLYRHIGFVLQDVRLIHASLRDNIALGRPYATDQEIEQAARLANIHEHILTLPRGYDSVVGEDAQLSGGEQQRLSIARAVLLDPPVLVLDEATAAADAENEVAIQQALSRFAQGRTLLVIAHRLDTIQHADRILVLDGGRIVEQGSHEHLLSRQGRYARLWALGGYADAMNREPVSC